MLIAIDMPPARASIFLMFPDAMSLILFSLFSALAGELCFINILAMMPAHGIVATLPLSRATSRDFHATLLQHAL